MNRSYIQEKTEKVSALRKETSSKSCSNKQLDAQKNAKEILRQSLTEKENGFSKSNLSETKVKSKKDKTLERNKSAQRRNASMKMGVSIKDIGIDNAKAKHFVVKKYSEKSRKARNEW
uniref:Uncharacterized protein n=1 Tax=Heterorhabditis bacteriophora TaxID=37862 RepID=A0A1I7XFK7_HETBA